MIFRKDRKGRSLASIDIKTAFLQSKPYGAHERARYIKVKHPLSGEWLYYRLLTPMYGQRSAPRRWEDTLAPWLEAQGFTRGCNDASIFYRESDGLTVLVYVDDLLVDGDDACVKAFLKTLQDPEHGFECNEPIFLTTETPIDFIGILISLRGDVITLDMETYIDKLLDSMGMSHCTPRATPFANEINDESRALNPTEAKIYRSGVGGIGWLVNTIRVDLAYYFSMLGSQLASPNVSALQALKHTMRYLKGTKHYKLSMKLGHDLVTTSECANNYKMYVDSNHGNNSKHRKSQTGEVALANGVPIKWKSKTQSIIATSSAEAEIYAASTAVQDFMHLSYVAEELGVNDFPSPFPLHIDNAAAKVFADDTCRVSRLKHIDMRCKWVKQMRNRQIVFAVKVPTDDNIADVLTKPLPKAKLEQFCRQLFDTTISNQ